MDPHIDPDAHISNNEQGTSKVLSPSQVITPTKSKSRGLLVDLAGWPSYSNMRAQAPGSENSGGLYQPGNLTSGTPSEMTHALGTFQKSSHLPTPHSPGNMASYLTRTTTSTQNLQPDLDSTVLPTEFRSHASSSSPPFRPHSIPTPDPSPLVAQFRSNGPHLSSQIARTNSHDNSGSPTPSKRDGLRSRASTPPRTPSWHVTTRPVTPVFQSRPTTPVQRRPAEQSSPSSSRLDNLRSHDSTTSSPSQKVKDEPGGEAAHIRAQLTENHLASTQAAESRRPDYLKRMRRLAPSNSTGAGTSFTSDLGGKDGSLLWSSANVGVIDSPVKGKRIALFQETSEESFEESLMAGGYGRYRSDRPLWKLDEDIEAAPNRLAEATEEEGLVPGLVLTEEGRRKKARLAAFLDPPREPSSATQLFPVEIQGCGRVLMRVEPSEPQTPPKPTPKTKRSRKRKNMSADMKQDVVKGSIAAPEDGTIDGPNWPDTEFPWRSRLMTQDGLSSAEREERLRYIESFLDRDSDEDVEEGHSLPSRRSPDEASSRSPQPGRGKMYPVLSHSKKRPRGSTTLSLIRSDPADAKTALLSKKSIRAVQLRLLRRRNTDRTANGGDSETLCICQGRDDGRPLVQCDACQTWYHLECIGIQSTSELGREEDPWFCANCVEVKTPPPVDVLSEPTFVPTDDGEHGVGRRNSAGLEEYDPLFLNAGLNPSPATPWTRSVRPPTTPPRTQHAPNTPSGSSWDEPPSSSSRGDPRTPQFNTASAFGDMVRVYGTTPGRLLEPSSSTVIDGVQFDPTSTPSRGIRFGLPFTTPKGLSSWQGVRGTGQELFHTPLRPGEDGNAASSSRYGQPLLYHGRVGEVSEEGPSGVHMGLYRTGGTTNVTPVERDALDGPKRLQVLESPLGAKRSRRTADS